MDCLCRPSRIMPVRINLLDETDFIHEIKDDLPGQALLDVVFARLNLIETSYFGLRYIDEENQTHWLDPASRISRQLKPKPDPYDLYFGVKFYAADPCKLLEEITRYQLFLQVKQDVIQGRLPVAFELAAELGAFVVQSELGDYDQRRHSKGYVSEFRLMPNQSSELETRVGELHQQLKGMSPATAELNYLDKVKWHDMYGVDLHPVLGEDSVEYFLGLTPSGIVVLRNKTTVAHYYWPRIAKVYYKGRYFMLRISDKNNELSTYGFETPRKSACKHLWRCCVEHHAFFRSLRVAPLPNSQSNTSDLFQIGSRLKYSSGRSEKQVVKDTLSIGRAPPTFTRVPSKRQPRRMIEDFLSGQKNGENFECTTQLGKVAGMLTPNYESPYRSTYSIPTSLGIRPYQQNNNSSNHNNNGGSGYGSNIQTPDSPRSTRSAPWPRSQQRSLFGNNPSSPRSVRSASTTGGGLHHHHQHQHHYQQQHHHQQHQRHQANGAAHQRDHVPSQRYRSSSVESHSSNDSRSTRRHKHRHRRTSDNESELSRSSGRSGRSYHRKHRRSRHRRDSGGSDHESTRGRSYSGHRASSARSGSAELIDSALQWREVQRRQAEASLGQSSVHQASVSKSSMLARSLHSNDSHSDTHSHHKSRRHRKNKSPSDSRNRIWSSELAKHLQFDLVDTTGMTEDQLREIPYTVVETNSKRSNSNLKIHKSNSKNSVGGKSTGSGNTITNGSGSGNGQGKNRVDRIRGLYFQSSHPTDNTGGKNGSIRSASTISSRECERNNGLVRMMSSMSMGDFISPTGSNLSPLENSALRVSHEHTDSGLGADQDYAYSSERSSDSTRYGTNKSSGASSGSHRKSAGAGSGSNYNNLMQQTVSNQQQTQRQNSFYAQRQQAQKQNFKFSQTNQNSSKSLAPIHNTHSSTNSANNNNSNTTNPGSFNEANTSKPSTNRLLNYTTFENNQYKFSLNNVFSKSGAAKSAGSIGGGSGGVSGYGFTNNQMDSFLEWPNSPAAPYYYNGPPSTNINMKKRDAKSDIGVPIRRLSGQAITKTQLLSGQLSNASCYPMPTAAYSVVGLASHLHPAKSDLFLSYMHSSSGGEYERPYIYNYKMPDMPEFMRPANTTTPQHQKQQQQQHQQNLPQQTNTAYHISGAQTADPPPVYKPANSGSINNGGGVGVGVGSSMLYGGAAPATDVMYYQFDNGKPPIVQQPKSLLNKTTNDLSSQMQKATTSANVVGPLVYLQHGQNVAPTNATSAQQTCTNHTNTNNSNSHLQSPSSEDNIQEDDEEEHEHEIETDQYDEDANKFSNAIMNAMTTMSPTLNNNNNNSNSNSNSNSNLNNPTNIKFNSSNNGSNSNNNNGTHNNDSNFNEQLSTPTIESSTKSSTSNKINSIPTSATVSVSANVSALENINLDNCNANVNVTKKHASNNTTNPSTPTHNTPTKPTTNIDNFNSLNANNMLNRNQTSNTNQNQNEILNQNHNQNQNPNRNRIQNSHSIQNQSQNLIQNQNQNISSSLEIILSPIIQSSRRAQ